MLLDIKNEDSMSIITFIEIDRIDTTNLKELREELTPVINDTNNNNNKKEQILDFNNIDFIDSSGLTMIINLYKNLTKHEKSLKIINVNKIVLGIFNITKLNTFMSISSR